MRWLGFLLYFTGAVAAQTLSGPLPVQAQAACINPTLAPYNADPTKKADSTAALQAAITAGGDICVPSGSYKVSATINVPAGANVHGAGPGNTIFFPTQSDDVFAVGRGATAFTTGVAFSNFRIFRNDNPAAGAGIHLVKVQLFSVENIQSDGQYIGFWCESCFNGHFSHPAVSGGNTSTGSAGMLFTKSSVGGNNSEVFVENANIHPVIRGNLTYAIFIGNADGIWISGHIGFSSGPALSLVPDNQTSQLTGIHCGLCEFDSASDGVYIAAPAGYTSLLGNFQFASSAAILMSGCGVRIDPSSMPFGLQAPGFLFNQDKGGTLCGTGTNVSFPNSVTE